MKKDTENNNVSEIKSKETIESTRKCLVGADWILKPANRVIAAWKFSEDGTFNFSTEALGGCSAWGNWKIISPDKIQINYTRFTGGINLNDEIITLTDCNSLKSGKIEYSKQEGSVNEDINSIDGTYLYKDDSAELEITISGDTWTGKTTVITGFGSDYDNQNTNYDNGIVKNNNLYNSSGTVKVGYINGNSLITSVGEHSVTLLKN
ncbi:hypothetical protein I5M32_12505 [Pedobacter sp. SD-b]|uniref:Uncharacterized protein n=1 Tax=Pedobacter segetis TaxID=2793069 RepID=A0ABS1BLM3_9SPHI|nr:hypothetical protein [Pedobacter segetis]MBK0383782.1 hypothetical protein [Pedobacter segetis]